MTKFLKIYLKSASVSVAQATMFRGSFVIFYIWLFLDTIIRVLGYSAIFTQVDSIGGWSFAETFYLVALSGLMWDFTWCMFLSGFEGFMEDFPKGGFDFVLLKPMSPLAYLSATGFHARSFSGSRIPLLIYGIVVFPLAWQLHSIIFAIVTFFLGVVIIHAIYAIFTAFSIWMINTDPIMDLSYYMTEGIRYPISIFPAFFRFFFTFIFPIIFVSNVPVMILKGSIGFEAVLLALAIAVAFEAIAYWFWSFSAKHYSSASS